jgi:hypothetical protein
MLDQNHSKKECQVLNEIKHINAERSAEQGDLIERTSIKYDDLVVILNSLYEKNLISAASLRMNKGKNRSLKVLDFIHITAIIE